jgi:heme exporter protein A
MKFSATNLQKKFGRRLVFSAVSFSLEKGDALSIAGKNGSGKSTLAKICAGVLSPNNGTIDFFLNETLLPFERRFQYIGFVAPYLQLYDEFTPSEHIEFLRRVRNQILHSSDTDSLLERVKLLSRKNDFVRTFSSGMKQRLKYALALLHSPSLLILDEPTSNLDEEGRIVVFEIIREQRERGMIIVATNEQPEVELCNKHIQLQ